jgi:hypothetical protein
LRYLNTIIEWEMSDRLSMCSWTPVSLTSAIDGAARLEGPVIC